MPALAVFAYGSLVDPASVEATLGVRPTAIPATLHGWQRRWSLLRDNLRSEKTFAPAGGGEPPPFVLGLNVEPVVAEAPGPNGALLEVTTAQLERLDLRELRYDRVDVTAQIDAEIQFETVFTYQAKPEHFAASPPPGAVILASYLATVEAAFAAVGETEIKQFREATGPPPVDVIEAVLVEDAIPPGNPRGW